VTTKKPVVTPKNRETMQPTASKSALLLECSYPFSQARVHQDAGEAADYGSCFHELLGGVIENDWGGPSDELIRLCAKDWGLGESARAELAPHLAESAGILRRWLQGTNPFNGGLLCSRRSSCARDRRPDEGRSCLRGSSAERARWDGRSRDHSPETFRESYPSSHHRP
jgi:hypothetical protein